MLTNTEVLEMLVQVQEQTGDWRATLDELVDTVEKAVTDEENEAFEKARRTESDLFDDTDADLTDADPFNGPITEAEPITRFDSRWESAGMVDKFFGTAHTYRDTL